MRIFTLFSLCLALPGFAHAYSDLALCRNTPTASIVGQTTPPTDPEHPCAISAKIQAIAYECGKVENNAAFTEDAFLKNIEKAKKRCDDFCGEINSKCVGQLDSQPACGFTVAQNHAVDVGKNVVHCAKRCEGQALNYCSLYHASYFGVEDRSFFKDMKENCHCHEKEQP